MPSANKFNQIVSKLEAIRDAARELNMPRAVLGIEQAISDSKWEIKDIISPTRKNQCKARIYSGSLQCSKNASKGDYCGTHAKIHK